jgi:hypothetical protein
MPGQRTGAVTAISHRARYHDAPAGQADRVVKPHHGKTALDGSVPEEEVLELIEHFYDLVVARLTKPSGAS